MNTPAPELQSGRITIHDAGKRERTVDRPLEPRYKKLYEQWIGPYDESAASPAAS